MDEIKGKLAKTLETLKAAYEQAKAAEDSDLCERLMAARENLQELREMIGEMHSARRELEDKIVELTRSIELKPSLVRHMGVYWTKGDSDPWCPACWEKDQLALHMNPTAVLAGRLCVCKRCEYSVNLDNVFPPREWTEE